MSMLIQFENVGRDKKSWQANIKELSENFLRREVHKRKAIASQFPDFEMDDDGNGTIYAGMRAVGTFKVISDDE